MRVYIYYIQGSYEVWRIVYTYLAILKSNRIWIINEKKTSKYFKAISYSLWLTAKTQMIYLFN